MTVRDHDTLKGYFNTGDVPTESNFADLIDSIPSTTIPLAHASTHKYGGLDLIGTAVASANAIPMSGADGKLDAAWIPDLFSGVVISETLTKISSTIYQTSGKYISASISVFRNGLSQKPGSDFYQSDNLTSITLIEASKTNDVITATYQKFSSLVTNTEADTLDGYQATDFVKMSDSRLVNLDRLTLSHSLSVTGGGSISLGGFTLTAPATGTIVIGTDSRLTDSRTPLSHAGSHVTGGNDIVANAIAAGNSGLMTGSDKSKLDAIASGATVGATWGSNIVNQPSVFTPTLHVSSHKSGGVDSIALDTLAVPTDITTLNATTLIHGLLPKLGGGTANFLRADGTWATPTTGASGSAGYIQFNNAGSLGSDAGLTWDDTNKRMIIGPGAIGNLWDGTSTAYGLSINRASSNENGLTIQTTATSGAGIAWSKKTGNSTDQWFKAAIDTNNSLNITIATQNQGVNGYISNALVLTNTGNVGLGMVPFAKLDAAGQVRGTSFGGNNAAVSIAKNSNANISVGSGLFIVNGSIGGNNWVDIVIHQIYGGTTRIGTANFASPPGRTYSDSGGNLNCALDNTGVAGTYAVYVTPIY
jgi:hypothetical protein